MVYEQQSALQAGGQAIILEDPGVFYFFSILQQGHTAEEGEKSLEEEIERLKTQPVSAAELEKSKNQIIANLVFQRETALDKANDIGHAAVIQGDWRLVNRELAEYQKVTAADVQAAAGKYFRPENRTVVYMLPEAMKPKNEPKSEVKP
jgi:zinc protease